MANGTGDVAMIENKEEFDGETSDEMKEIIREMKELNSWYKEEVTKKCELEDSECETCLDCLYDVDSSMNAWIMDLTEQNGVFLSLIKEAQEEGNIAVEKLERKLSKAKIETAKVKVEKQKSKLYVDNLLYEKSSLEKQHKKIQEIKKMYNVKRNTTNEKVRASEKQLNNLHELSYRLQRTGIWDIQDLQLDKDVHDKLFKENPEIIGAPCVSITENFRQRVEGAFEKETLRMDIRLLNESIKIKNKEIDELKEEMQLLSKKSQIEKCDDNFPPESKPTYGIVKEMQTTVNITDKPGNPNSDDEKGFIDEFLMI